MSNVRLSNSNPCVSNELHVGPYRPFSGGPRNLLLGGARRELKKYWRANFPVGGNWQPGGGANHNFAPQRRANLVIIVAAKLSNNTRAKVTPPPPPYILT